MFSSMRYSLSFAGAVALLSNVSAANVPGLGDAARVPMPRYSAQTSAAVLSLEDVYNSTARADAEPPAGATSGILLVAGLEGSPSPVLPLLSMADPNTGGVAGNDYHHGYHEYNHNDYFGYPNSYGWRWPKYGQRYYGFPPKCDNTTNPVPLPGAVLLAIAGLMGGAGARFVTVRSKQM